MSEWNGMRSQKLRIAELHCRHLLLGIKIRPDSKKLSGFDVQPAFKVVLRMWKTTEQERVVSRSSDVGLPVFSSRL